MYLQLWPYVNVVKCSYIWYAVLRGFLITANRVRVDKYDKRVCLPISGTLINQRVNASLKCFNHPKGWELGLPPKLCKLYSAWNGYDAHLIACFLFSEEVWVSLSVIKSGKWIYRAISIWNNSIKNLAPPARSSRRLLISFRSIVWGISYLISSLAKTLRYAFYIPNLSFHSLNTAARSIVASTAALLDSD